MSHKDSIHTDSAEVSKDNPVIGADACESPSSKNKKIVAFAKWLHEHPEFKTVDIDKYESRYGDGGFCAENYDELLKNRDFL